MILSGFNPTIITDASSIASGRSWASRIFNAGKFNVDDSSEIVRYRRTAKISFAKHYNH
jgi:dephospho-CoA kinase